MSHRNLKLNSYCKYLFFANIIAFNCRFVSGQSYRQTLNILFPDTINYISIDGKQSAYYELYLTNFSTDTIKLKKLSIRSMDDSTICFQSQNEDLKNRFSKIGYLKKDTSMLLSGGCSGVIYIELNLQKKVKEIAHFVTFEVIGNRQIGEHSIQTFSTKCNFNDVLVLGAPLQDGIWTAIYEPSWERGHRKVIYTLNGKARIPGRYAIDFIKMDTHGKYAKGDENNIGHWFGYGADVLAVADGVVTSIRDDFTESQTLSDHPKYSAENATGNYISLKTKDNRFAFYEHLKPKSIKVKKGQTVKKGDVIASLGFTGQTTGPHLHFHVADTDSPLGAEGIPFVFETFEVLGAYSDFTQFGKALWTPIGKSIRYQERPLPNCVIKF
jgi:murein DD-endopeptidase